MANERILIADDNSLVLRLCNEILTYAGYRVSSAGSGQDAITILETEQSEAGFDLLIIDIRMPGMDGLTVLRRAKALDPNLTAVVITAYSTLENAVEAINAGARRFILKPFGIDELLTVVQETLDERRYQQERLQLRAQLPILEAGQALITKSNIAELSECLLEIVAQQIGAERAALLLLNADDTMLQVAALIGPWSEPPVSLDPQTLPPTDEPVLTNDEIRLPLRTPDRVVGLLILAGATTITRAARNLLPVLGGQVTIVLENARLFDAVDRARREWNATFDAISDSISIHDTEFRIVRANRALGERLGIPPADLIGRTCYPLLHKLAAPVNGCPHAKALATGKPHTLELDEPVLGGTFRISAYPMFDEQGQVRGSVHIVQDITQQKLFQAQLIRSEKLAALGRLAASLAHEINNPLQALRSGLGLLTGRTLEDEKRQRYLQVASREVERLISITERILGFYRPSAEQQALIDINHILDETLTLADKKLQHGRVTVQRKLSAQLPLIAASADQVEQVFLNVILNALEAMPDGGELTVETGQSADKHEVWIAFTDTGVGITDEDLPHIFEPLYTTKSWGTGLGLAISYGIIERHGGRIEVNSRTGDGSTFTIFLPVNGVF